MIASYALFAVAGALSVGNDGSVRPNSSLTLTQGKADHAWPLDLRRFAELVAEAR
jgi:hypothetical protein